uniref:CHK kinase-like domain-containing protein n=1 Tax=Ditylenchus dipsaci TaxID=166011 RepID=A0A915DE45_9BILA
MCDFETAELVINLTRKSFDSMHRMALDTGAVSKWPPMCADIKTYALPKAPQNPPSVSDSMGKNGGLIAQSPTISFSQDDEHPEEDRRNLESSTAISRSGRKFSTSIQNQSTKPASDNRTSPNSSLKSQLTADFSNLTMENVVLVNSEDSEMLTNSLQTRKLIQHSDITIDWLLQKLKQNDQNFVPYADKTLIGWSVKKISDEKAFLSQVFRIRLQFHSSCEQLKNNAKAYYSVVLKIPGLTSVDQAIKNIKNKDSNNDHTPKFSSNTTAQEKETKESIAKYHETEAVFYTQIAPCLDDTFPVAKMFGWKPMNTCDGSLNTGVLLMEDLSENQCTMLDFFETFNVEQVYTVVRHIAYFHKWSLENKDKWEHKFIRNHAAIKLMAKYSVQSSSVLCRLSPDFKPLVSKLVQFFSNQQFLEYFNEGASKDAGLPRVLLHGDLWSHNIMWKKLNQDTIDKHNHPEVRAILDWQIMHQGNCMNDLARLLVFCCDAEIREEVEKNVFTVYKTLLQPAFEAVTVGQLKFAYKYAFLHEVCILAFVLPFMLGVKKKSQTVHCNELWKY